MTEVFICWRGQLVRYGGYRQYRAENTVTAPNGGWSVVRGESNGERRRKRPHHLPIAAPSTQRARRFPVRTGTALYPLSTAVPPSPARCSGCITPTPPFHPPSHAVHARQTPSSLRTACAQGGTPRSRYPPEYLAVHHTRTHGTPHTTTHGRLPPSSMAIMPSPTPAQAAPLAAMSEIVERKYSRPTLGSAAWRGTHSGNQGYSRSQPMAGMIPPIGFWRRPSAPKMDPVVRVNLTV